MKWSPCPGTRCKRKQISYIREKKLSERRKGISLTKKPIHNKDRLSGEFGEKCELCCKRPAVQLTDSLLSDASDATRSWQPGRFVRCSFESCERIRKAQDRLSECIADTVLADTIRKNTEKFAICRLASGLRLAISDPGTHSSFRA